MEVRHGRNVCTPDERIELTGDKTYDARAYVVLKRAVPFTPQTHQMRRIRDVSVLGLDMHQAISPLSGSGYKTQVRMAKLS